jgi:hypothetical protein
MKSKNEYQNKLHKKRYYDWKIYFIKKYGVNPLCEICGLKLQWYRKNGTKDTAYFDHKSEGIFIKGIPTVWFQAHACIKVNIEKFEKEGFGIVCCRCNQFLPTKNRLHWLKQVTNYILK